MKSFAFISFVLIRCSSADGVVLALPVAGGMVINGAVKVPTPDQLGSVMGGGIRL